MAARRSAKASANKETRVELAAELRMAAAPALRETLLGALKAGQPVVLDGAGVSSADAAALQVLYVFARDGRASDVAWSWSGVSDALRQAAGLLGMESELAMPAAPAS